MASEEHLFAAEDDTEAVLVEKAYIQLVEGTYPTGATKNEKRSIRRKMTTLAVRNGVLFYKKKDGNMVRKSQIRNSALYHIPTHDSDQLSILCISTILAFLRLQRGEDKQRNLTRSEKYQSAAQLGIEPNIARGLSIKERSNIFVKSNDETPVCCVLMCHAVVM